MAKVTVTNLTESVVPLQELYSNLPPLGVLEFIREEDQLHAMPQLQKLWYDSIISVSVVKDTAESLFIGQFLHTVGPAALSSSSPSAVTKSAASPGVESLASRTDHKHDISTAVAVEISDSSNAEGASSNLSRSDHSHSHGQRGGGSLHPEATVSTAGFMSASDKQIIDSLPSTPADYNATTFYHEPILIPSAGTNSPGQQPTVAVIGSTLIAEMSLNTDYLYNSFKISSKYSDSPSFHVHWTKQAGVAGNGNQSGKSVRWRISYVVYPSTSSVETDINITPVVLDLDDTYTDSGTTTRMVARTSLGAIVGAVAGYYVGVSIQSVTPSGTALTCKPALLSVDLSYNMFINK